MPDALVGMTTLLEQYHERLGAPVTGATLTLTLTGPSGTVLLNAVAATDAGGGWYSRSVPGSSFTVPGFYHALWSGTDATGAVEYDAWLRVAYATGADLTRVALRHRLARVLGDLWLGTATGGSTTTLLDSSRPEPDNHWRGYYLHIYGGTGRLQERRLSASTQSGGVLTWTQAGTAPVAGSLYELHRKASVADYNDAINAALAEAREVGVRVTVVDETILVSSATTYEYTIPPGFWSLAAVDTLDTLTSTADWLPLSLRLGEWAVVPGRRVLRLARPTANTRLRLVGQALPADLLRDQAYCDAPVGYILQLAAAALLTSLVGGPQTDPDAVASQVTYHRALADRLRPPSRPLPNAIRVT